MSSATQVNMAATRDMLRGLPTPEYNGSGPNDQLSERQIILDHYWRYYRCTNYDGRAVDWDGRLAIGMLEIDQIATSTTLPPGFEDVGMQTYPLKLRRPTAPYYLAKVIVLRFNSMLFSATRHPQIACDDPQTEDWLQGFAEETRLWMTWYQARIFGGAMGSVGVGFKFVDGKPIVEVHDPRWCEPEFSDPTTKELESFEKRYQYVKQVRTHDGWEDRWFWYRRVIDKQCDTVWPKVPVSDKEPDWNSERKIEKKHGFGFVPVVWVQNQPVDDDTDGDPDCHGCFEKIEAIDALAAQAQRGTMANCDPSLVISSDAEFDEIRKGSGTALQIEKGGEAKYIEITGAGIEKAITISELYEKRVLTMARCVLDRNEGGPSRTVDEIEHNYSAMIDQCDVLREQYGERGVKKLLQMVLKVARAIGEPRVEKEGEIAKIVRSEIRLPKKAIVDEKTGQTEWRDRVLGKGEQVELRWPKYFTPSQDSVNKRVEAAKAAKEAGLIDTKHGIMYVAEDFHVENVPEMMDKLAEEKEAAQKEQMKMLEHDAAQKVADRTKTPPKPGETPPGTPGKWSPPKPKLPPTQQPPKNGE